MLILFAVVAIIIIGSLLWYAPTIISVTKSSSSANSSESSYTSLLITSTNPNNTIEFGDTIYNFYYASGAIGVSIPFQADMIQNPQVGHTYQIFGVEIKVENISSNYLYDYTAISVKPTVENYMFSTYRETMVDIPLEQNAPPVQYGTPSPLTNYKVTVNISSGIVNETNQYTFEYAYPPSSGYGAELIVSNSSQSKQYEAYVGLIVAQAEQDFNIEIRIYSADSGNMIIYVKPLY